MSSAAPVVNPGTSVRPLAGGTSLVSAQATSLAPAASVDSFDAPEGLYVCTSRFTPPPQPMIHLNPLPTTLAQLSAVYPMPRLSTVSLRYPASSRNYKAAEKQREAAKLAAAAAAQQNSSAVSDSSSSSNDVLSPALAAATSAAAAVGGNSSESTGTFGPMLESPLASQGIDAPANSLTGGLAAGVTGSAAGIAGIGGPGMGFSGLGEGMGKQSLKPSRPKNNLKNTSSNFVNRMMTHPELTKIIASRTDTEHYTFMSNARSFFWLADTNGKTKESLARITFSASPTSHDVNQFTRSHDRLDIIIGFVTGDLIWLDPIASKYSRINKGGCITSSAVTQVRWLPGSENLIMAAHADGTLLIYDRDRDDSTDFVPAIWDTLAEESGSPPAAQNQVSRPELGQRTLTTSTITTNHTAATATSNGTESAHNPALSLPPGVLSERRIAGALRSDKDPLLVVTKPGAAPIASGLPAGSSRQYQEAAAAAIAAANTACNGMSGKGKETSWNRLNPVSHWVCSHTRITDFAFSPDFSHLAIVAEDGILRIADINSERLLDTYESYYGGLSNVVWSPDGKFVLTGGQDDLVTIWAPREGRIVARCQGHTSFVTGLAWDPWRWSTEDRTYRFASVGEDCKLIFWDFSSAALKRPKTHGPYGGMSSGISGLAGRRTSLALGSTYSLADKHNMRRMSTGVDRPMIAEDTVRHPALPRSEVAILQPVMTVDVGGEIPTSVRFSPDRIVVFHKNAALETFTRPMSRTNANTSTVNTGNAATGASTGSSVRNAMQSAWSGVFPGQQVSTPTASRFPNSIST